MLDQLHSKQKKHSEVFSHRDENDGEEMKDSNSQLSAEFNSKIGELGLLVSEVQSQVNTVSSIEGEGSRVNALNLVPVQLNPDKPPISLDAENVHSPSVVSESPSV